MALTRHGFAHLFLSGLELPAALESYVAVVAWVAHENAMSRCNPLAVAGSDPPPAGATPFNSFTSNGVKLHVWNYPTLATGLEATIRTFSSSYYNGVRVQMANRMGAQTILERVAASPWGSFKASADPRVDIASLLNSVRADWGRYAMAPIPGT